MPEIILIECYAAEGCQGPEALKLNAAEALRAEGAEGHVSVRRISGDEALALGFRGSPTVLVNGTEVDPPLQTMEGFA